MRWALMVICFWMAASCAAPLALEPVSPVADEAEELHPQEADRALSAVEEAMRFAPLGATTVQFTDWTQLKQMAGAPMLTSEATAEELAAFVEAIRDAPLLGDVGVRTLRDRTFFDIWGWHGADLLWEASYVSASGAPVQVVRLRDDFDFEGLSERFTGYYFALTEQENVRVFTSDLDFGADWFSVEALRQTHNALWPEEKILIFSAAAEPIQSVLDAAQRPDLATDFEADLQQTAARLESILAQGSALTQEEIDQVATDFFSSAMLATGRGMASKLTNAVSALFLLEPGACSRIGYDPISLVLNSDDVEMNAEQVEALHLTVPEGFYLTLAIGAMAGGDGDRWRTVMTFATVEEAAAAVEIRRAAVEADLAVGESDLRFYEVFRALDAAADDRMVVVDFAQQAPISPYRLLFQRQLAFAGCR